MAQHSTSDVHGISRVFHAIDSASSRAGTAAAVLVTVVGFLIVITIVGFRSELEYVFTTIAAAITLVMVFAIQHAQTRQQMALQIKLDEILRALPGTDERLVHIEIASDQELSDFEDETTAHHVSMRSDGDGPAR